jgi:hypothetical protein
MKKEGVDDEGTDPGSTSTILPIRDRKGVRARMAARPRLEDCTMTKSNKHIGSSLEDFLQKDGILEETCAVALKETVSWQVRRAM